MDYYDLLGVKRSASADELKTAYKRQAMKNHPDKGGDPEKFKQINEAYQALSDPQQKQMYDQFGTTDPQQAQMNQGGFHFTSGSGADFDDILRHFGFGAHFGQGFANQRQRKNKDIRLGMIISFAEIFTGKTETVTYKLPNGQIEVLDVKIPPGIRNGDNLKFRGYGDNSISNIPRGDLIIQLKIVEDPNFHREGDNVYMKQNVDVFDLLTGIQAKITTPEKKIVNLNIPAGTQPNTIFSLSDYGIPNMNTKVRGKLFVEVTCRIPKLSKNIIDQLEKIKKEID